MLIIGILLLGYAFLDKSFAYIGVSPLFIGEISLAATLFLTLLLGFDGRMMRSPITLVMLAFLTWQLGILIFSDPASWLYALRDAAIWYYAIFALIVANMLMRPGALDTALQWYARFMPLFAVWAAPAWVISDHFKGSLPLIPGTDVTILQIKAGDIAVHLAGAAAFLVLGLNREFPKPTTVRRSNYDWPFFKEVFCYCGVFLGMIATGSRNRGGFMSVLLALVVVTLFRPNNRLSRFVLPAAVVAVMLVAFDVRIPTGGGREISVDQIFMNVESVFVKKQNLTGTVEWRLEWWEAIVDDTIFGDNILAGLGYGDSLAPKYGFTDDTGNRSPHSAHLTFLARSGLPGLLLWVALVATLYIVLARAYVVAQVNSQYTLAKINLWVMAYLTAFFMNMSVDVYLEGPQGGIWFWSLIGLAIALNFARRTSAAAQSRPGRRRVAGTATTTNARVQRQR
jgi:hypothetical protein